MKRLLYFLLLVSFIACSEDDEMPKVPEENFDRQAMLENWADNIIIPAFDFFASKTSELKIASDDFATDPTQDNLSTLVEKWEAAYIAFQNVSMFEIGKAEELRFTNNLNIYPTDVEGISNNALNGDYNLELPSQIDKQGFPAMDYLLFGIVENSDEVLSFYQNDENAEMFLNYLKALTGRADELAQTVATDWKNNFRNDFVANSGNSATASVDKLTNDFIFYYERHLRAGKIGIPAGVFSGNTLSQNVEAYYRKTLSKALFNQALIAVENFFNGTHFSSTGSGESMKTYIEYLDVMKNELSLAQVINDQFQAVRNASQELSENFAEQVETDNVKMLATYDQLQLNVVNIKVDMLQAFNINVDYVDADGD